MGVEEVPWEDDKLVVVVVGDVTQTKSQIAEIVANLQEASPSEQTTAGVRIFTSASSKKVVIDTVNTKLFPAAIQDDLPRDQRQQIARQWISQNSLRRLLLGKYLHVICLLTCPKDCPISGEAYGNNFGWLEILGVMFQEHKKAIQMVVDNQHIGQRELPLVEKNIEIVVNRHGFLSSNIAYVNWRKQGDKLSELFKVEDCVRLKVRSVRSTDGDDASCEEGTTEEIAAPFLLKEPASSRKPHRVSGTPWGPERVMLFGRTGSGKSTLAQMLTNGELDPNSKQFSSGSGIRGETKRVSSAQGRGWYVVDTPGFGEPNRSQSTVTTQQAEDKIKKFVRTIDGLFTHFLFLVKKGRIDELEVRLWRFFVCLFGHNDINDHFSIVITNADDEWVKANEDHLGQIFQGCGSFLSAEFPSSHEGDEEWEEELQELRKESLNRMEDALANLSRKDIVCEFGDLSKTAVMNRHANHQGHGLRHVSILVSRMFATMSCLTQTLTIDQDIALLPF